MLSDEQVKQFQALYRECFGKKISKEEAYKKGASLLRLVELVYRPMTKKEYEQLKNNKNL